MPGGQPIVQDVVHGFCKVSAAKSGSRLGSDLYEFYLMGTQKQPNDPNQTNSIERPLIEAAEPTMSEKVMGYLCNLKNEVNPRNAGEFVLGTLATVGCGFIPVPASLLATAAYYGATTIAVRLVAVSGGYIGDYTNQVAIIPLKNHLYPPEPGQYYPNAPDPDLVKKGNYLVENYEEVLKLRLAQANIELKNAIDHCRLAIHSNQIEVPDTGHVILHKGAKEVLFKALEALKNEGDSKTELDLYQQKLEQEKLAEQEKIRVDNMTVYELCQYLNEQKTMKP